MGVNIREAVQIGRFDTDDTRYRGSQFPSSASPNVLVLVVVLVVLVLDLFSTAKDGAFAYAPGFIRAPFGAEAWYASLG
jgi:hypothetical protein